MLEVTLCLEIIRLSIEATQGFSISGEDHVYRVGFYTISYV
jgi:hypothetical protein